MVRVEKTISGHAKKKRSKASSSGTATAEETSTPPVPLATTFAKVHF